MKSTSTATFLVLFSLSILAGCAPAPAPEMASPPPRLVLLYATCSLNRDFAEPYNPAVTYTPALAAFARDAIVFERHHTEAGKSAVAYSSIYTATHAHTHGVYLQAMKMRDEVTMLSEAFRDAGWDTHFWDNHPLAKKALNFAQGVAPDQTYSSYGQPGAKARSTGLSASSPEFAAILDRLASEPEYRVLIIANNAIPHSPYHADRISELASTYPDEVSNVDPESSERLGELYSDHHRLLQHDYHDTVAELGLSPDEEMALAAVIEAGYKVGVNDLDTIFGGLVRTIDERGLRGQSLIAFTSDHGELMDRDNALTRWSHGWELAPEVIQVPLIIRLPEPAEASARYAAVTRSIDLFPTLAGLAGVTVETEWGLEGEDLSAAVSGSQPVPELTAFFHSVPPNRRVLKHINDWPRLQFHYPDSSPDHMWVGLRRDDTVVFWRPDTAGEWSNVAYDLAIDPALTNDLFDPDDPGHAGAASALTTYKKSLVDHFKNPRPLGDAEELEMLRSLGYVQ